MQHFVFAKQNTHNNIRIYGFDQNPTDYETFTVPIICFLVLSACYVFLQMETFYIRTHDQQQ